MENYDDKHLAENYSEWLKHMDSGIEMQRKTIDDFLSNLNLIEKEMAVKMSKLYFFWYSKLHEVIPAKLGESR